VNKKGKSYTGAEEIGICETTLATIMGAKQQTFTAELLEQGKNNSRG
jgi:hypothetical protein